MEKFVGVLFVIFSILPWISASGLLQGARKSLVKGKMGGQKKLSNLPLRNSCTAPAWAGFLPFHVLQNTHAHPMFLNKDLNFCNLGVSSTKCMCLARLVSATFKDMDRIYTRFNGAGTRTNFGPNIKINKLRVDGTSTVVMNKPRI